MANEIKLSGVAINAPEFSHVAYGERFYQFYISSPRRSGTIDVLPCIVSETLVNGIASGEYVSIIGEIRTKNMYGAGTRKMLVHVFVRELIEFDGEYYNNVFIAGKTCKEAVCRTTPFGRYIGDIVVGCRRSNGLRTDYIPCVAWGRNTVRISNMDPETNLGLWGRFQSRNYTKKTKDGKREVRTAYEVSLNHIEELPEQEG